MRAAAGDQNGSPASRRAARLLATSPGLGLLPDPETPAFSIDPEAWSFVPDSRPAAVTVPGAQESPAIGRLGAAQPDGLDVWLGAKGERYSLIAPKQPPRSTDATALSGGGLNYEVLPQIMVGALVQFDQQGEQFIDAPRSLSDQGWMAGPVTTVRLAPGISLDARAAWGESKSATPYSAASGPGAERRLVNARLTGSQSFGPWRFSPSVVVDYHENTQLPPDPSMAPQSIGSGRVDIRPALSYRLDVDGSTFIEPSAAISSSWDIDSLSTLAPDDSGYADLRLKAEAGLTVGTAEGTTLQATGALEENSTGAADIWRGRIQVSVPLK